MEDTKTFIANIRCDYRYIAKIAKYVASKGIFVETKSKIASEAIRMLAYSIPDEFNSEEYGEAVIALRTLGYRDELRDNSGYYRELNNRINLETDQRISETSIEETTAKLVREYNEKQPASTIEQTALKSILAPDKDKSEPEPESESKLESEPESESPQLKIRTADDEKKDISKLRAAMSNFNNAPVLEENTGRAGHNEGGDN